MRRSRAGLLIGLAVLLLAGCVSSPTPSPSASRKRRADRRPIRHRGADRVRRAHADGLAGADALSLDLPGESDDRVVAVTVEPQVDAEGGEIVVTVTSEPTEMIEELVLRWPRELNRTLFLRPFEPSEQRIADGGPPLVQEWTKWVLGPGEEGEPAGTVSLGWGPLLPGATLTIPVDVVRRADGPVAFDLQILADNAILTLADGEPAELRVDVP